MNNAIEAVGLTKRFGEIPAVEDLCFSVGRGEILGLLGPNGAGKTTTARLLAGMMAPTSGYAEVLGMKSDRDPETLHRSIGLLTETPGFYERMTALENLLYFAGFYDIDGRTQARRYLVLLGLWEKKDQKVSGFSKGMRHKLALARALLHEPEILFLDEPTAGLDPEAAQEVRSLIRGLNERGRTVFLSTHNLEEAEQLCNRVALIRTNLILVDSVENLRKNVSGERIEIVLENEGAEIARTLRVLPFVRTLSVTDRILVVETKKGSADTPELIKRIVDSGGRILSVKERSQSLEDLYLILIRNETGKNDA
ncbi:MAG: ABC transporter ATP-binding protein [Spirochaetes bacterium]|nr:ABC transporter ATP-binding protein [Spirochaetota bacterium]